MEYALSQFAITIGSPKGELFPTFSGWALEVKDHFIPHPRNNFHPHVLGHRVLGLFSLLLITVKVAAITLPLLTLTGAATVDASAITNDTVFSLTNSSRIEYSLKALTVNSQLTKAAQNKANDMLAKQYFAHVSPDGHNPWYWIKNTGYNYLAAGENLAVDFTQAESVETAWMNSPGHRANILNPNFEEIGVGISHGTFEGHDTIFVVQMFGTPASPAVKTLAEPTIVVKPSVAVATPQPAATSPQTNGPAATSPAKPAATQPVTTQPNIVASQPNAPQLGINSILPIEPLLLANSKVIPSGGGLNISTTAGPNAVKVIATYGLASYMLNPTSDGQWKLSIPVTSSVSGPISLTAYDINGKMVSARLATMSPNLESNYSTPGSVKGVSINFFGRSIDTSKFQYNFYLISIMALLTFMLISIGVRYKVQHVSMIANSSFVVMLACLLWMAG